MLVDSIAISKHFLEVFEASKANFGRLEDVDPNGSVDPHPSETAANFLENSIDPFGKFLRILVENSQQSISQSYDHLDPFSLDDEMLFEYF